MFQPNARKLLLITLASGAFLLMGSTSALALGVDFVAQANLLGEGGAPSFVFSNIGGSGINLTVTARDLSDGSGKSEASTPLPYLDDPFQGRPGGLGVCQDVDPACDGNSDDNLGSSEVVILAFSAPVTLSQVTFNNGIHNKDFVGSTGIHVGAGNPTTAEAFSNLFASAALLSPNLTGSRFSFVADESFLAGALGDASQLYLETVSFTAPVPEPGSVALLGVAALLGAAARKRSLSRAG